MHVYHPFVQEQRERVARMGSRRLTLFFLILASTLALALAYFSFAHSRQQAGGRTKLDWRLLARGH